MDKVLDYNNGTGPGETHSWGRCEPTSHLVPGPSVIASTSRRSGDAPPEGRPTEVEVSNDEGLSHKHRYQEPFRSMNQTHQML